MVNCCSLPYASKFCFRVPDNYLELLSMLPDRSSYIGAQALYIDRSSNLLHAAPIKHDPYTPDSMDSPSPNAILAVEEVRDVDINNVNDNEGNTSVIRSVYSSNISRNIDKAVSPALLKSKLELIVRNKKCEVENSEEETSNPKVSLRDCQVRSWPEIQNQSWDVRKTRRNSDISWQRSHILTHAWLQGKSQQGYHSFNDFTSLLPCKLNSQNGGSLPDLVIPRIAIINASNIESNESSVYLYDDKISNYPDSILESYFHGQIEHFNRDTTNTGKINQESERLSAQLQKDVISNTPLQFFSETTLPIEICQENNTVELIENTVINNRNDNLQITTVDCVKNTYNVHNDELDISKKVCCKEFKNDEKIDEPVVNFTKFCTSDIELSSNLSQSKQTDFREMRLKFDNIDKETCNKQSESINLGSRTVGLHKCNVISACSNVDGTMENDVEIARCESKPEITSRNTTRSNSIQSQDISDNVGNVRLKLKAYKVTQKCKSNIVKKRGKCQKCCCIVS